MTYSGAYNDYMTAYGGTHTIEDMLSSVFRWDPPTELPTMYVQKPTPSIIAPHIDVRSCKHFFGHKFRLGGSKK